MSEGTPNEGTPNPASVTGRSDSEVPAWVRESISEANKEAAKYRVERNSARDNEAAALKDKGDLETKLKDMSAERDSAVSELNKYKALVKAGFDVENIEEYADRVRGATAEELEADAKKLFDLLGPSKSRGSGYDHSQGRGSSDTTPLTPQTALAGFLKQQFEGLKR